MDFRSYETHEAMLEDLAKAREEADARTKDWQRALKPGDFFLRIVREENILIYSEVLDPVASSKAAGGPESEQVYLGKQYAHPNMACFRFCNAFSIYCPEGELGDVHLSTAYVKLSKGVFETLRAAEWPADANKVFAILAGRE